MGGRLAGQFWYETLIRTLRSSFLIGGAAVIVSSTGAWKYLVSSFAADPRRWVLAAPGLALAKDSPVREAWRQRLCTAGIRLGLPYLPTDFGYASTRFQFRGSLSQVAPDPGFDCARMRRLLQGLPRGQGQLRLPRVAAPLAPDVARQGVVIPFQGDLAQLGMLLREIQPQWVVVGGAWGRNELFDSPVGPRYGVQLQAAALAGRLRGYELAPLAVQLLVAWLFLAIMDLVLGVFYAGVEQCLDPWKQDYPGHRFLAERLWPIALVLLVSAGILTASYAAARLWMLSGYWIASPVLAAAAWVNVLFVWKWGLARPQRHDTTASAWTQVFLDPVRADWRAMRAAAGALLAALSGDAGSPGRPGAARSLLEWLAAGASLLVQTGFPLLVIWRALRGNPL